MTAKKTEESLEAIETTEAVLIEETPKVTPPKPAFKNPPAFQRADSFKGMRPSNLNNNRQRPGRAAARGR